jgi:CubicO group peptidase (beta-lactamase class C family)
MAPQHRHRVGPSRVHGDVRAGYGTVADTFASTFERLGETGAACAVFVGGELVIDLWGGTADAAGTRPWSATTMVPVFSASKGASALVVAHAVAHGLFGYDDTVSRHWPEFARHGKSRITVRQLMGHRAGLAAIDRPLTTSLLADPDALADVLADQTPNWDPGRHQGYHCWTLGWYQSELIRRTDPAHRTLGQYLAEELVGPLGGGFHIGLPDDVPDDALAEVCPAGRLALARHSPPGLLAGLLNPRSLIFRAMGNPRFLLDHHNLNVRAYQRLEIGSGNGIGTARALAALYDASLRTGPPLRLTPAVTAELQADDRMPPAPSRDLITRWEMKLSAGMMKSGGTFPFGSDRRAYGFWGAGGSCGFADPTTGVAYAWVSHRMGPDMSATPRETAVRRALGTVIGHQLG